MLNIDKLMDRLEVWNCDPEYYSGCVEPGYPDTHGIKGNWNNLPKEHVAAIEWIFNKAELGMFWCDEWTTCEYCDKAVRIIQDSYSWKSSYVILNECEAVCHVCVRDNLREYLVHLSTHGPKDTPTNADTFDLDFDALGLNRWKSEFYSGFYPGQNSLPEIVIREIREVHPDAVVVFRVPSIGQFDITFLAFYATNQEKWEEVLEKANDIPKVT